MADKYSQIARGVKPYIIAWLADVLAHGGAVNGGSGGVVVSGAPSPHALSSVHHSGVLLDTQGPQFLLLDGSRDLTGDLAVDAGITIDGVDLSAHAANPAAHHAPVTAGNTAISVSTQAVSVALNATASGLAISSGLMVADAIAGAGLVIASKVLAVGAGDGIDVAADSIAVDITDLIAPDAGIEEVATNNFGIKLVASGSGLSVGAGGLMMGTPTTLTVSTTNSVTAGTHSHAITASADVGTTPAAALLKSTSSGGLILGTLEAKGSVDITNGGNLYVAGGVGGASGILVTIGDTPDNSSVGIGRVPDQQFDLDVAGALRAQYLVGKHAIQLSEALLIAHFDGRGPYNTNTVGDYHGHAGQVPTVSGDILVREGLYASSIEIAGGYTNLDTNPEFAGGSTSGYSDTATGSATGTRAATQEDAYAGDYSYKIIKTGGADTDQFGTFYNFSATDTLPYAADVWVKVLDIDSGGFTDGDIGVGLVNTAFTNATNTYTFADDPDLAAGELPLNEWVRLGVTNTATSTATGSVQVRIADATTATILISAVQVIQRAYNAPYFNGTRTAGNLSYAGIPVNWRRLTWMAWIRPTAPASAVGVDRYVGALAVDSSNRYSLYVESSNDKLKFDVNGSTVITSSSTVSAGYPFTHVAVTVSGLQATLYINGVSEGTGVISALPAGEPTVYVGDSLAGGQRINGHIDDFVITSKVEPAKSIRSIYESDAPVFAESSVFHFKATPTQLVWADDEGLWMRDVNGEAVAGFYGGEAATKSWGGFTLEKGDIAFGRYGASDGGWLLFDRDGVSSDPYLTLGYSDVTVWEFDSGGASLNGVLDITTTGGIYQGSGTFASPTTGMKLFNSGGVGKLSGYNGGVEQVTLDTDGKLKAGAGDVTLDATGVTLAEGASDPNSVKWLSGGDVIFRVGANDPGYGNASLAAGINGAGGMDGLLTLAAANNGDDSGALIQVDGAAYEIIFSPHSASATSLVLTLADAAATLEYANFNMAAGYYMASDKMRALSSSGLRLEDDGGNLGLFVEDGGEVGIKQTAPAYHLHIGGVSGVDGTFAVQSDAGRTLVAKALDSGLFAHIGTESNHVLRIITNNTEAIEITAGQLVGINVGTPSAAQFEVVSSDAALVAGIFNSAASPTEDIFRVLRNTAERVTVTEDGWLKLVDQQVTTGPILYLQSVSGSAGADLDLAGTLRAMARNSASVDKIFVDLYFQAHESGSGNERGAFFVDVQDGGADSVTLAVVGNHVGINKSTSLEGVTSLYVKQPGSADAIPTLTLEQTDLSEEFINFVTTVGTGNPIDTAALGSYYGKVRVQVEGVGYKYIALYN